MSLKTNQEKIADVNRGDKRLTNGTEAQRPIVQIHLMSTESQEKCENVCRKMYLGEFPGGSVVRILQFHH